jgi:hypothetical protein
VINLKNEYGKTYRITLDESASIDGQTQEERLWLYQIPCKFGHIFVQGENTLGAYCNRIKVIPRLIALPGVRVKQRGDREVNVAFDPAQLAEVAQILRARKRMSLSPERREQLRLRMIEVRSLSARSPEEFGGNRSQETISPTS